MNNLLQYNNAISLITVAYSFKGTLCRRHTDKWSHSTTSDCASCVSSRITAGIHVETKVYKISSWIVEPFAVASCRNLYTHMHGLIFETSI